MSTINKQWLHWTPRVLAIVYILFLAILALGFIRPEYSLGQIVLGLFLHLMPSFTLMVVLAIAWRWALPGGALFLILGMIVLIYFGTYESLSAFLLINLPYFVIGLLFVLDGWTNPDHVEQHQVPAS